MMLISTGQQFIPMTTPTTTTTTTTTTQEVPIISSPSVSSREVVSWVLAGTFSVLFTGLVTVLVLQWLYKKRQAGDSSHTKTSNYVMEGNASYKATEVKQIEDEEMYCAYEPVALP